MAAKRQLRLPTQLPPIVLGLLGVLIILQQTFVATVDRPWLLAAGLTLLGIPVFFRLEPPGQTPPSIPPAAHESSETP